MRLFYHLLDMTVINTWIMYKNVGAMKEKSQKDIMKLADFRTKLADTLCRYKSRSESKRKRPSNNSRREETLELTKKPRSYVQALRSSDVRYDHIGHEKMFMDSRNKCKYGNCRKLTSWVRKKCQVSSCDNKKKTNVSRYFMHKYIIPSLRIDKNFYQYLVNKKLFLKHMYCKFVAF